MHLLHRLDLARLLGLASRVAIVGVAIVAATGSRAAPASPAARHGVRQAALRPLLGEIDRLRATAGAVRIIAAAIPAVRAACAPDELRFDAVSLPVHEPATAPRAMW